MAHTPSPLEVVETHFAHLAPTHLTLHGSTVHPWLDERTYSLHELRELLMTKGTPYDVRDAVWRDTIRAARLSQDWMLGALGLCMPALRSVARRTTRNLTPGGVESVESAILCEVIGRVRTINLDYARLAWYLTRPAHRAALSARKHEMRAPLPDEDLGRQERPDTSTSESPELLLVSGVRNGVLSTEQARLIARTRLENQPLAQIAQELGVAYKALAKRRERAEARLVAAVHAGEVTLADTLAGTGESPAQRHRGMGLVVSEKTRPTPVSHSPLPLAS